MTQARLLDIAVREFGQNGLDGASTRAIARAAGTAMSSITYHYGGKDGLYLAAADRIAERMADALAPALAAEEVVADGDRDAARAAVQRLIARFVDTMASDETADWSLFIAREQFRPGEAFERIWAGLMGQLAKRLADLICLATGTPASAARVATLTLMGQALIVRSCHAAVLKLCEIPSLDAGTLTSIKARIAANADAILDRMIAENAR